MIADALLWARLQEAGTLQVDPALVSIPDFLPQYDWVRRQMARRLVAYHGGYPWWAWAAPKPDLRSTSYHNDPPGAALVRLALVVPVDEVLCFDFHAWHVPLNDGYLSVDEAEDAVWEALPEAERTQEALEASWERLFEPAAVLDSAWYGPLERVQAVFETLRLADVTGVTHYRSRIARRDSPSRSLAPVPSE
ncbi:MAG: DUF3841 domain-containing protein [Thermomicrobiales bacterium]